MFFSKLKENLKKTKDAIDIKISNVFANNKDIDEIMDDLEETLILSDIGVETSMKICNNVRDNLKKQVDKSEDAIKKLLKQEMKNILAVSNNTNILDNNEKQVIMVVGVNGVGKTTSIAKLSNLLKKEGKKVLLVAADTFRAGAVEQLDVWAKRIGIDIYMGEENAEPASVIYDATKKFKEGNYDILICDTAGRLHNKKNLMDELEKMNRVLTKNLPDITKNVIMVLDATTGGNGVSQIKSFFKSTNVNGIILTKLDSTAKGGVVFSIVSELNIPILYVGTGETVDDIEKFNIEDFVEAII
ncbi:signal recognition particle receptor FtsY [Clostridium sp. CAG:465]|jgi:signal recognition particle-docking protein ftsY|nr:signal recognition particle receptor FtsY [Clostridium sp. CAG:465]